MAPRRSVLCLGFVVVLVMGVVVGEEGTRECASTRAVLGVELDSAVARKQPQAMGAGWALEASGGGAGDDGLVLRRSESWGATTTELCLEDGVFEVVVFPVSAWACESFEGLRVDCLAPSVAPSRAG